MDAVVNVLNFISENVPVEILVDFLLLIGATGLISGLMTPVTAWLKQRSQLFKMFLVYGVQTLCAGLYYLATSPTLPPELIPAQSGLMFVMSQPFYLKLWQPLAYKVKEYIQKATAFDEQLKAATQPDKVVPEVADFSS